MGPTSWDCNLMVSFSGLNWCCPFLQGYLWTSALNIAAVQHSCISKGKYTLLCIERNPDVKHLLSQKERINSQVPDVGLSWSRCWNQPENLYCLSISFGPSYIELRSPLEKEQHLIHRHGERCWRGPHMCGAGICITTNENPMPRSSMPST